MTDNISLIDPAAIEINNLGDVYISDNANNTIYKLSSELTFLKSEGGMGVTGGSFNRPAGIATDAALNVYVADSGNRRIVVLDRDLHFVRSIALYYDEKGNDVRFDLPHDLSIDKQGNLWIADDNKGLKIDPFQNLLFEVSEGAPVFSILGKISSLDATYSDQAILADIGSNKILVVTIFGSRIGDFAAQAPASVSRVGKEIWVANGNSGRISVFDQNGNQMFAYYDEEPGSKTAWLAVSPDGKLAVVDRGLRRIKLFEIIRRQNKAG